ncbi:MAG: 3-oxo-5-alpha-steroid 4-dehydrogenase [Anaerolineae bacterium]|nr:3-oxo-5-alpha-steroid 4-dehydrogenase [Anaerolineae bacterium]
MPIFLPEPTLINFILYGAFTVLALSMGPFDYFGPMPMRYSKFRGEKGIFSRAGMFFLYFIPLLAALGFSIPYLTHPSLPQTILLLALLGHFAKRCLEVLFLHKYSGPMDFLTALSIAGFYSLVAAGTSSLNAAALDHPDGWFWLGTILFAAGETLNFWHHKLLADQRGNSREYVIPRGGLFGWVACPHYLFELLAWLGIALISRHLFVYISFVGMFGYLLARSLKTLAWYRAKFPDFPKERKALIPWLI